MYKQANKNWMVAYWHWTSKWTDAVGTHGRHLLGWAIVGWKMGKSRTWEHNKKTRPERRNGPGTTARKKYVLQLLSYWAGPSIDRIQS